MKGGRLWWLVAGFVLACESVWGIEETAAPAGMSASGAANLSGFGGAFSGSAGVVATGASGGMGDRGGAGTAPSYGGFAAGSSSQPVQPGDAVSAGQGGTAGPANQDNAVEGGSAGAGGVGSLHSGDAAGAPSGSGGDAAGSGGSESPPPSTPIERVRRPIEQRPFRAERLWPPPYIPVCYRIEDAVEPDDGAFLLRRAFVSYAKRLVHENWIRHIGRLRALPDFQDCEVRPAPLELVISDTKPSSADFGYDPAFASRNVTLNINASDAEILYFFGRVLGFGHEYGLEQVQGRCVRCTKDADCSFDPSATCLSDGYCGRAEEHESIMAAPGCGGIEPTRRLTPWDIVGAQRAYGPKPPGLVVNRNGECMNIYEADVTDGTWLVSYACYSTDNDTWSFEFAAEPGASDVLVASVGGERRCIEMDQSYGVSSICDPANPNQDVRWQAVQWRGIGGMCVVPTAAVAGAELVVAECGTQPDHERWTVRAGTFQLSGTELCASVGQRAKPFGYPIVLEACGARAEAQRFLTGEGLISPAALGGCLNVVYALPQPNAKLGVWPECNPNLENERFFLSGPFTLGGQCVALEDNLWLSAARCDGTPDQDWDYRF